MSDITKPLLKILYFKKCWFIENIFSLELLTLPTKTEKTTFGYATVDLFSHGKLFIVKGSNIKTTYGLGIIDNKNFIFRI